MKYIKSLMIVYVYRMDVIVSGVSTGVVLPTILSLSGVNIGRRGIDYYAEVHTKPLNSYSHTIGMPFTIYGMLLWIPMIFNRSYTDYKKIQQFLYIFYMTHYILIDSTIGGTVAVVYAAPVYYANLQTERIFKTITYDNPENKSIHDYFRLTFLVKGLMISTAALLFQEGFGHWLSGDPMSRLEGVPNAILYAMYYSVSHLF